jgi:hypothetical protein
MPDRARGLALTSAFAGVLAIVVGAFALGNVASALAGASAAATLTARAVLIAAELAECAAFAIAALAWVGLNGNRLAGWASAALKLLTFAGLLAIHWSQFWYFMLDLRGPDGLSLIVVILSGVQALLLCLAALGAGRT